PRQRRRLPRGKWTRHRLAAPLAASLPFDGTHHFLVYSSAVLTGWNTGALFGTRLTSPTMMSLDAPPQPISPVRNQQLNPALAFNGTNYLVAYEDHRAGDANVDIWATRVSRTGAILDPDGLHVSGAAGNQLLPQVASNGTDFMVVWEDYRAGTTGP